MTFHRDWTESEDALLLVGSDMDAARAIGCRLWDVRKRRIQLGIIKKRGRKPSGRGRIPRPPGMSLNGTYPERVVDGEYFRKFPKDLLPLLGTMSDRALADLAGVSYQRAAQLRNGRGIKSFGRKFDPMVGRKVRTATVLYRIGKTGFRFQCRCGREFERGIASVRSTTNNPVCGKCGDARGEDLAGRQWTKDGTTLTAVRFLPDRAGVGGTGTVWEFHCSRCGNLHPIITSNVTGGRQSGCGCLQREYLAATKTGLDFKAAWAAVKGEEE